ncbi:hypothetical protein SEVIR_2G223600v4 [Setaria viridis]|uniref:Uncharacterized protein n=2 Tax=Setaria TaxID=4554 RepID=A0A368Q3K1_SETIT|nr:hypothetical protein SETIT_2G214600v2 [Setaria italica]TKW33285.1 hypothetical protein SEVIR_2G223600v2 [Setaria viridis]
MQAGMRKKAVALTLLTMIVLVASSSARGGAVAAARLHGEAGGGHGHRGRVVAESIPAVDEGKGGAGPSNCTHNFNQHKFGPCPPE